MSLSNLSKLVIKQENVSGNTRSKISLTNKKLFNPTEETDFVSATKSFNYIAEDEFSDLVNLKNNLEKKKEKEEKEEDKEDKDFKNFFTDMGHLFEKRIIEYLVDTYGIDSVKQICEQNEIYGLNDIISLSKQTIKLI